MIEAITLATIRKAIIIHNRPSLIRLLMCYLPAPKKEIAIPLYEKLFQRLTLHLGKPIQTGEFGADMKVSLLNDGPVTIIIDTKNRE
jgi:hypothetical protein